MARLLTEGFESGDVVFFQSGNAAIVSSAGNFRSGLYSAGLPGYGTATRILDSSYSELYIRYATKVGGFNFGWWNSGTQLGGIRRNGSTNKIEIYTSTGTLVATGAISIILGTWYVLEIRVKIADSGGVISVKVDGVQDATFTGDTKPGAETTFDNFKWTGDNTYLDDIAINDTFGAVDNSWCGDGRVIALTPNGNGDLSQLTNQLGNSTDNYSYVDEKPSDGDTDYVQGSTVDQKDLYALTDCGLTGISISRVWAESRSRDTVAAGGLLALTIKTNSTEYSSADIALLNTYSRVIGTDYPLNPNTGVAWTIAQVDALQAGPKTRS